ncbi:MAG TPA: hypothetical protein VFZ95_02230 [Steroidobacteraceae bacterium]
MGTFLIFAATIRGAKPHLSGIVTTEMRNISILLLCLWQSAVFAQCAPAPDSSYFFRNLSEQRAEAKIAADAAVYEKLLSNAFQSHAVDGKLLNKQGFIAREIAARPAAAGRRFYAISNYTLIEHRQGHTEASYLLTEGVTGNGHTQVLEWDLREIYEVIDGQWRLASVEATAATVPSTR